MRVTHYHPPPRQPRRLIINFPLIPSLPYLISQFLINQQGLYVDFCEHGRTVAAVRMFCQRTNWVECSDMRADPDAISQAR